MATIADLSQADLSSLSDEELLSLIKDVRARRRDLTSEAHKESVKKAVAKKKKGKPVALKTAAEIMQGLSPEDAGKLLELLRNKK